MTLLRNLLRRRELQRQGGGADWIRVLRAAGCGLRMLLRAITEVHDTVGSP